MSELSIEAVRMCDAAENGCVGSHELIGYEFIAGSFKAFRDWDDPTPVLLPDGTYVHPRNKTDWLQGIE